MPSAARQVLHKRCLATASGSLSSSVHGVSDPGARAVADKNAVRVLLKFYG